MSKGTEREFQFQGSLLPSREPRPGEKGYLEPGFHLNEQGEIVDDRGNVYDKAYNIVREALSEEFQEGLRKARRQNEQQKLRWSEDMLTAMARHYASEIRTQKEATERDLKKKKRKQKAEDN